MAWRGLTVTTPDDVTHALEESASSYTVWMSCAPWCSVHAVAMIWIDQGKPQNGGSVDCMTCLVAVSRRSQ